MRSDISVTASTIICHSQNTHDEHARKKPHRTTVNLRITNVDTCKMYVSTTARSVVIRYAHSKHLAGHPGTEQTQWNILEHFHLPGVSADVRTFVLYSLQQIKESTYRWCATTTLQPPREVRDRGVGLDGPVHMHLDRQTIYCCHHQSIPVRSKPNQCQVHAPQMQGIPAYHTEL
ncbi:hypothetical protein PR048_015932 [Dryococelus australis]|uniref:Integrase zinc-binding domain-containing protein n=1 Tax=Dryococelus australis TaxID=614101 RepID=A0ABQ9HIH7_9NEOP|nr:hypothetical protein PR048_015932 [Dryococelus australis]